MLWTQEAINAELDYRRRGIAADRARTATLATRPERVKATRRTARAKHRVGARQPACPA